MIESNLFKIFKKQFTKVIKVIVIHGPTASGKTTFANNLYNCLEGERRTMKIHLDDYYRTLANEDVTKYDFDNPAVFDWKKILDLVKSIHDGEEYLPTYKYSFLNRTSEGPFYIENIFPEILIIEGLYSMNIFNEKVFDLNMFDPTDSSKEGYTQNTVKFQNFGILNIKMVVCKKKMEHTKIKRDIIERNHSNDLSKFMFEKQSWPAALRWVYSKVFKSHIDIIHGSFNNSYYKLFFGNLTDFLIGKSRFSDQKVTEITNVDCSGECLNDCNSNIILYDKGYISRIV